MKIDFELLEEPKLQFGEYFEHEDTKTGLAEFGPFGRNIPGLHKREVNIGIVGTGDTITKVKDWLDRCSRPIESQNIRVIKTATKFEKESLFYENPDLDPPEILRMNKILNRDFVGFNLDTSFECCFQLNTRWERRLDPRELNAILAIPDKHERISKLVDLLESKLTSITENSPAPDLVIIAITSEIEEQAETVRVVGNFYLNLRHALKARAMRQRNAVPIQLIRASTLDENHAKRELQEVATRAWNFCVAQYYKAEGIPWRPLGLDQDTCYIGVSFYIAQEKDATLTMRSSIALAFDYLGQGLILRGDEFEWDKKTLGRSPHLTKDAAKTLIQNTLREFTNLKGIPPKRVVIHKSSEFWGADRGLHNEVDGFYEGIDSVYRGIEADFVSLRQTGIRLFREGNYPPLRGMHFTLEKNHHFLYTMGYIPYLETFPQSYVPEPWQMVQHIGGSSPKQLFQEVLALTKMNMNNCSFADGTPITISFARKIGEVMKHVPTDGILLPQYRFYM
jgi:hypothetical protein